MTVFIFAASKAPPAKKGRHSIETATPSAAKKSSRPSRRSLPAQKPAAEKPARPNKRKAEEQPEDGKKTMLGETLITLNLKERRHLNFSPKGFKKDHFINV